MNATATSQRPEAEEAHAGLERSFLEAYLREHGQTLRGLSTLPEAEAKRVMREACGYASARLAELEARSRFVHELYGVSQP